jgi:hypothetical protein
VTVEARTGTGWAFAFAGPRRVRCQVSSTARYTDDGSGAPAAETAAVLAVPPTAGDTPAGVIGRWPLSSRVTVHGRVAFVQSVEPVLNRGRLAYVKVVTGDRTTLFGGAWPVDVVVHHSPGRDRRGNPVAGVDEPVPGCLVTPGESAEPLDLDEATDTTATLHAPPGVVVEPTASVTVTGSPLAGRWSVAGEPAYHPDRTTVPLRRQ